MSEPLGLVEYNRRWVETHRNSPYQAEAARRITVLLAEVERLRERIDRMPYPSDMDQLRAERDRAEAAIARVRKLAASWDDVIAEERNRKRTWCAGMIEAAQSDLRSAIEGTDSP